MAGDWIKMRGNLWDDPRVARICDMTDQGEAAVVGALYWLWATADQHTEDGIMPGLTLRQIDRKTGIQGFAEALMAIGWVADHPEGIRIINFEEHNGSSAKKRALTAKRVSSYRRGNADVTQTALQKDQDGVTGALAREREEKEKRYSVPNGTGADAPPVSARDEVFALGVPLLTSAGVSDKNARSMLAGLCKKHGEAAVRDAIHSTAHDRPVEPVGWLQALLQKRPQGVTRHEVAAANRVAEFAPGVASRAATNILDLEAPSVLAIASR